MGKSALVTGADGFVGRHMVARLERNGWDVIGVDIKSGVDCRDVFRHDTGRFDLVVHLAAMVGGRQMIDNQPMIVASDFAIDSDFFQYVIKTKPRRSVYYSSSAAYPIRLQTHAAQRSGVGALREEWIEPSRADEPDAIYGWVKLTGERLAAYANAQHNAGIYVFRPFSGYGSDQDLDYPFPSFAARALQRADPFVVWGDGQQVRDWVHIDDVVSATLQTLEWDPTTIGPQNICTGVGTSMIELADLFMSRAGYAAEVKPIGGPTGVERRVGDPTVSHKIYTPAISIEEGVDRALREIRS